jgi:adenylate kinase
MSKFEKEMMWIENIFNNNRYYCKRYEDVPYLQRKTFSGNNLRRGNRCYNCRSKECPSGLLKWKEAHRLADEEDDRRAKAYGVRDELIESGEFPEYLRRDRDISITELFGADSYDERMEQILVERGEGEYDSYGVFTPYRDSIQDSIRRVEEHLAGSKEFKDLVKERMKGWVDENAPLMNNRYFCKKYEDLPLSERKTFSGKNLRRGNRCYNCRSKDCPDRLIRFKRTQQKMAEKRRKRNASKAKEEKWMQNVVIPMRDERNKRRDEQKSRRKEKEEMSLGDFWDREKLYQAEGFGAEEKMPYGVHVESHKTTSTVFYKRKPFRKYRGNRHREQAQAYASFMESKLKRNPRYFNYYAESFEAEDEPQAYLMCDWNKKVPYEIHNAGCKHRNFYEKRWDSDIDLWNPTSLEGVCRDYIQVWEHNLESADYVDGEDLDAIAEMTFSQFMRSDYTKTTTPIKLSPCHRDNPKIKQFMDNTLVGDISPLTYLDSRKFRAETFEAESRKCGVCRREGHTARQCVSENVPFSKGGFWREYGEVFRPIPNPDGKGTYKSVYGDGKKYQDGRPFRFGYQESELHFNEWGTPYKVKEKWTKDEPYAIAEYANFGYVNKDYNAGIVNSGNTKKEGDYYTSLILSEKGRIAPIEAYPDEVIKEHGTTTWGDLKKQMKGKSMEIGEMEYSVLTFNDAFKYLPTETILRIRIIKNALLVISFVYDGEGWDFMISPSNPPPLPVIDYSIEFKEAFGLQQLKNEQMDNRKYYPHYLRWLKLTDDANLRHCDYGNTEQLYPFDSRLPQCVCPLCLKDESHPQYQAYKKAFAQLGNPKTLEQMEMLLELTNKLYNNKKENKNKKWWMFWRAEEFEADSCRECGRKEGAYSDTVLVGCEGCPELCCQHCLDEENNGCAFCIKKRAESTSKGLNLVMMGVPGSGKGTQSKLITKAYGWPQIGMGDLIRDNMKRKTPLGKKCEPYMATGSLVPDEIMIELVSQRLKENDCKNGFILDGFPRTVPQGNALEKITNIDAVFFLDSKEEVVIERLGGRRTCSDCGEIYHQLFQPPNQEGVCDLCNGDLFIRPDDNIETIMNRLSVFNKETEPLINFYTKRNLLKNIESNSTPQDVFEKIEKIIKGMLM